MAGRISPVRVLLAGACLTLSTTGCSVSSEAVASDPGPPPPVRRNPPRPPPEPAPLPSWDEVASGHPEGATNPPSPSLVVTEDGRCFKDWEPGMLKPKGDRVEECVGEHDCGVQIVCPEPKASEVRAAHAAAAKETGKK